MWFILMKKMITYLDGDRVTGGDGERDRSVCSRTLKENDYIIIVI